MAGEAVQVCWVLVSWVTAWSGGLGVFGSGEVRFGTARRSGLCKFWRGALRLGELRLGGSGGAGYVSERRGPAWRSRRVTLRTGWVRFGPVRLGGRGAVRCGAVRCGEAVVVRVGLVGSGAFRRLSLGEVR